MTPQFVSVVERHALRRACARASACSNEAALAPFHKRADKTLAPKRRPYRDSLANGTDSSGP